MKDRVSEDFYSLLQAHLNSLFGHAYTLTRSKTAAEDLVRDTCLKAYKAFNSQFERGSNLKAWLFTILRNTFINQYRRSKRVGSHLPLDDSGDFSLYQALTDTAIGEEKMAAVRLEALLDDEVLPAFTQLAEEYREVIFLKDSKNFSYPEIAEIIGIPIGTVRSRLVRGRGRLNELLWDRVFRHSGVQTEVLQ